MTSDELGCPVQREMAEKKDRQTDGRKEIKAGEDDYIKIHFHPIIVNQQREKTVLASFNMTNSLSYIVT